MAHLDFVHIKQYLAKFRSKKPIRLGFFCAEKNKAFLSINDSLDSRLQIGRCNVPEEYVYIIQSMSWAKMVQNFLPKKVYFCQLQNCDKYMRVYKYTLYVHLKHNLLIKTSSIGNKLCL